MGGELLLAQDRPLTTQGVRKCAHLVDLKQMNLHPGDMAVRIAFKKVFQVRSFVSWGTVLCWYDEIEGKPRPDYYQTLKDIYMVGCFYNQCDHGIDIASHFFVRKLRSLQGGLADWKFDFDFPGGVKKYSVCAVTPKDFVWEDRASRDPYNHAVSTVTWDRMVGFGVDMATLIDRISAGEFRCNAQFDPPY